MRGRLGIRLVGCIGAVAVLAVGCTITQVSDDPEAGPGGAGGSGGGDPDAGVAGQGGGAGTAGTAGTAGAGGVAGSGGTENVIPSQSGGLAPSANCDELEQKLKADAIERDGARIDREVAYLRYAHGLDAGTGGSGGTGGTAGAAGTGGSEGPSQAGGQDYTQTNAQAEGVDEADIVKTDGENIYFLHGEVFTVVKAWPADQMAFSYAKTIEGKPVEMFVHDGRAVVYSHVNGNWIYDQTGLQPKPRMYADDFGADGVPSDIPLDRLLTKATVIELQGNQATTTAEFYFEGVYLSARRVDDAVRTVVHGGAHGPELDSYPSEYGSTPEEEIENWEALRESNKQKIEAASYSDWMPYQFARLGGNITVEQPSCEEFFVPSAGSTSYGLVQLQTFSWTNPTDLKSVSLAARANHIYATKDAVYVAATATNYDYYDYYYMPPEDRPAAGTVVPLEHTHIHKFDVSNPSVPPQYLASTTVRGRTLNQFAMDEWSGHLRVATTERQIRWEEDSEYGEVWPVEEQTNHVFVLKQVDAAFEEIGRVLDLIKQESIYAVRFIEDRGYVVTFEELDPLFVIDMKTPAAPTVLGEVEIPGFSLYVHPIGNDHLLTIGKETEDQGMGPMPIGLNLQIFDVSTPTQPVLKHKHIFEGDAYAYSEAENNHKAFVYNPDLGVVVFPFVATVDEGTSLDIHATLEVFSVDITEGFTKLGAPNHDDFFEGTMWEWCLEDNVFGVAMRRGLFIDDYLYSISYGGLKVHAMQDLSTPVGAVDLSMPSALGYSCAPPY